MLLDFPNQKEEIEEWLPIISCDCIIIKKKWYICIYTHTQTTTVTGKRFCLFFLFGRRGERRMCREKVGLQGCIIVQKTHKFVQTPHSYYILKVKMEWKSKACTKNNIILYDIHMFGCACIRNEEVKIHSCNCMSVSGKLFLTSCEICGVLLFVVLYVLRIIIYLQSSGLWGFFFPTIIIQSLLLVWVGARQSKDKCFPFRGSSFSSTSAIFSFVFPCSITSTT